MSNTLRRIQKHKKAKNLINSFYDYDSHCLLIHYSCESFYDIKEGKTPRITSIAVRSLSTAQTKSFSIHKVAELKQIQINNIDENYDFLEKEMLVEFFKYVEEHKDFKWIHWNMRDINYGFEALKFRAELLGAKFYEIKDENKFDLARLLIEKYGKMYSKHPRLQSLMEINNISSKHWLNGEQEANAFENKEYVKLHQSTLAKVDIMENILKLTAEEDLKIESKFYEIYGISPQSIYEITKDNWLFSLIIFIISTTFGIILSKYFGG